VRPWSQEKTLRFFPEENLPERVRRITRDDKPIENLKAVNHPNCIERLALFVTLELELNAREKKRAAADNGSNRAA